MAGVRPRLWGPQNKCKRSGRGWQEADLAHSVSSTFLVPGRVLLGMVSGYRLWLPPVGRQTGVRTLEGRASRNEISSQAGTCQRSKRLN